MLTYNDRKWSEQKQQLYMKKKKRSQTIPQRQFGRGGSLTLQIMNSIVRLAHMLVPDNIPRIYMVPMAKVQ